jgi:hypothetical protein
MEILERLKYTLEGIWEFLKLVGILCIIVPICLYTVAFVFIGIFGFITTTIFPNICGNSVGCIVKVGGPVTFGFQVLIIVLFFGFLLVKGIIWIITGK